MKRHRLSGAANLMILTAAGLLAGCGGDGFDRVPITGTLTVVGEPLPGAVVQLNALEGSDLPGAIGYSDEQGKFAVISSREEDAGVPPGEYSVRVSRLVDPDGTPLPKDAPEADHPGARESIPLPFSGVNSPLKVTIPENGGDIVVDIPEPLRDFKTKKK